MSKKKAQKKVAKAKAEAKVVAEQAAVGGAGADLTFRMSAPQEAPELGSPGFDWEAVYAEAEVEEAEKFMQQELEGTETVVTVSQEKFNRAGFDILMNETMAPEVATKVAEVKSEKKTTKARVNDGFLGMTRRMYRAGKNGQQILEANRDARIEAGYDENHAMIRAKKDYGFVVREAKAEKKAEDKKVEQAAAANA